MLDHPYPIEEHEARCIVGDPQALAYAWILAYAANLNDQCQPSEDDEDSYGSVTVNDLLEVADSHQPGESKWGGDYLSRGGAFEGESVDPTFWKHYAVFRDKPIDEVEQAHFFSCSC